MRLVLVMDTCGGEGYVAVCAAEAGGAAAVAERSLPARGTQETLLPAVSALLAEAGVTLAELAAVAVVRGPGSFTGVRIGLATAKGLCEACALPMVVLSRLEVLARADTADPEGAAIWACLDAGRAEVYAQRFAGSEAVGEERLLRLADLAAAVGGERVVVLEESVALGLPGAVRVSATAFAAALRAAAVRTVQAEQWADVALSDAEYVRVPDAELALRARLGGR